MIILKKVPAEDVYYNFEDEVCLENDEDNLVIYGNRDFQSFGNKLYIDVIKGDYYDDELGYDYSILEELKKLTGKEWDVTTIKGYSQGDWQDVYYAVDCVNAVRLKEIEDFYMGKVSEFVLEEDDDRYSVFVPDDIVWKGKKAICDYLGLDPTDAKVLEDDGYKKVYKYKEIE